MQTNSKAQSKSFEAAVKRALALTTSNPSEAEALIAELLVQNPHRLSLLRSYGRLLMRKGEFEAASPYWERIRASVQNDIEARMAIARIRVRTGRFPDAVQALREVLQINSTHDEAQALATRIAEKLAEKIVVEGRVEDSLSLEASIRNLDEVVSGSTALDRLKSIVRLFSSPLARRSVQQPRTIASQPLMSAIEPGTAEFIDEMAERKHWLTFLALLEQMVLTGAEQETTATVERHRQRLLTLAEAEEREISSRARRLLLLAMPDTLKARRERNNAPTVEEEFYIALERLTDGSPISEPERATLLERVCRLAELDTSLADNLVEYYTKAGQPSQAIEVYSTLARKLGDIQFWIAALKLATRYCDKSTVSAMVESALTNAPGVVSAAAALASSFTEAGDHDDAIMVWRVCRKHSDSLRVWLGAIQLLYAQKRDAELLADFRDLLLANPGFELRGEELPFLVEIVRRARAAIGRSRLPAACDELTAIVMPSPPSAIRSWVLACLASAKPDFSAALGHFEAGVNQQDSLAPVNFQAEIATLYARYHQFGRANAAGKLAFADRPPSNEHRNLAEKVSGVVALCGDDQNLLYPECLIDVIFEELARAPLSYDPKPATLLAIVGSLNQGGSERQTVTVLGHMSRDPRISRCMLAVRSIEAQKSFFLPAIREMPIKVFRYGEDWRRRSGLGDLGGPHASDRLKRAVELLPHNLREDLIRLCRLIHAERPQAVHIRQDLYGAALASAVAGVPMTIIHRGSLSPDLWGYDELQTQQTLRPMRHVYRKLQARGGFAIVNNSRAGSDSDREWTKWTDETPFAVVHNAYDFEGLGGSTGRNEELRARLGIKGHEPVIGTAFRFAAVKRPMLWIQTALAITKHIPDARFIIVGDGPMLEEAREFAAAQGLGDRMHFPGRITDIGEWYRCMDLNLLTSEREGLPNVLIEGQHFGVPAVAADVGGAAETIDVGITGVLVPADADAQVFAGAVVKALRDKAWMENARSRAPVFVHTKFSAQRTVDQLLGLLNISAS